MNKLGEIKTSKELGYKTTHNRYIWASCGICHKERWVQVLKGKPQWSHCIECGRNIRKRNKSYNITEEIRQQRQVKLEQIKHDGIKCKRCNQIFPATKEYFPIESNSKLGLKLICKSCYNLKAKEHNLKTGKTKLDKTTYLKGFELKREQSNKDFNEFRLNQPIGILGEIKRGKVIGIKDSFNHQWLACESCGKERWVRLKKGLPQNLLCKDCGAIKSGKKRKGQTIIFKKTQKVIDTGLKECTKCYKSLPANIDFFVKSKFRLGIGAICKDCRSKISRERLESFGQVENICSICGRKKLIYNTGKQKSTCGGCSQKLSGIQKLPRPNKKGKPFKYIPKENSTCKICKIEYPTTVKYFKRNKSVKSGLYLKTCRKCLSKIKYNKIRNNKKLKINHIISNQINQSLRGHKNGIHWGKLVGYEIKDLMKHLESQFKDGMSWENYGMSLNGERRWEIDHIFPRSVFHFESPEDIDFKRCWALKNLQPLWSWENNLKGAKIKDGFQPTLK